MRRLPAARAMPRASGSTAAMGAAERKMPYLPGTNKRQVSGNGMPRRGRWFCCWDAVKNLFPSGCGDLKLLISHAARAHKHEEHRQTCSPHDQSPASAGTTVRTIQGFGWEGACTVRSLRHFIALSARILVLHTGHVRHRGGQQQRQQIVACACACEFVARLWGESKGGEQTFQ